MVKDILIKCWGETIEENGIETKKFLSYIITKEDFSLIEKYFDNGSELSQFDYIEITLDQKSKKIILDMISNTGKEKIIETSWKKSVFYNIISELGN